MFGGLGADGKPLNDLWVMVFLDRRLMWMCLDTCAAPEPRYDHTTIYLNSMLFIFGGRDNSGALENTLCIYMVQKGIWRRNVGINQGPIPRWGHCAGSFGTRMIVLGGKNHTEWISSKIYSLDAGRSGKLGK